VYGLANSWFGTIPDLNQLQNPIDKFASQVFSEDGEMIGTWSYSKENRVHINYNAISPYVVDALVSTEDERFYEHSGIDMKALLRAIVKRGIMGHKSAGGGSTITQQLAKQLYSERASSSIERALQKPTEWVVAVKLERYYTKEEIITMYLNKFDFLHNAVGIKNASLVYFGKEPADLSLVEAATLVGMCKNPSYFNPVRNPERCLERRNVVLSQMYKNGKLTADELNEAQAQPLTLSFHKADHKDGIAPYLREYLRTIMMAKRPVRSEYMSWQMQKYYEDSLAWETDPLYGWCNKNRKSNGDYYNIYTDGLRIHTTLNADMQRYAEAAVAEHVALYLQPAFNREKRGKRNRPYSSALSEKQLRDIL
jgi:penicillin-binding protein 1A